MNTVEILDTLSAAGLFRTTEAQPLLLPNGDKVPNRKAIVYSDTGEYISCVGQTYNLIQNEEVFDSFANSLVQSDLKTDGLQINVSQAKGGKSMVGFVFPEHSVETSKNDKTNLQVLVRNSYDGSWKFQIDIGGFRVACANGQVIGDYINSYSNMHTARFNVDDMVNHLESSVNKFADIGEYWLAMKGINVDRDEAIDMILDYLRKKLKNKEERDALIESKRATEVQSLLQSYSLYEKELGNNLFAVYNTLTDHATHKSDRADYQFDRGLQLSRIVNSKLKTHLN